MKKNKYNLEMLTKFKSQNYKIIKNKVKCKYFTIKFYAYLAL